MMLTRNVFRVNINQKGADSDMWYAGKLGQEFTVELATCASVYDSEHIASGWVYFADLKTHNAIDLTDCDIIEQVPNLVKSKVDSV